MSVKRTYMYICTVYRYIERQLAEWGSFFQFLGLDYIIQIDRHTGQIEREIVNICVYNGSKINSPGRYVVPEYTRVLLVAEQ